MVKVSVVFGGLLIANGLYGYLCGDAAKESVTALIPAVVGVLIFICGLLAASKESMRKHFMHFGAGVSLLGALAAGGRLFSTLGKEGADPFAQQNLVIMLILCVLYLGVCFGFFSSAREGREPGRGVTG